jgi:hypothetical protein
MRGVVNDKSEKAIAAQRATRMKTPEGQRPAVGYECAKHRNMAGIRLALANVRRDHASKCRPAWRAATPRTHPAPEMVKAANQQLTVL